MLLLTLAIIPCVIHGLASLVLVDFFVDSDYVLKLLSIFIFIAFTNIYSNACNCHALGINDEPKIASM